MVHVGLAAMLWLLLDEWWCCNTFDDVPLGNLWIKEVQCHICTLPDLAPDDLIGCFSASFNSTEVNGAPVLAWRIHRRCICPRSQHHRNVFKTFASLQSIKTMWDSGDSFAMNPCDQFRLPMIGCLPCLLWCSTKHMQSSYTSSYSSCGYCLDHFKIVCSSAVCHKYTCPYMYACKQLYWIICAYTTHTMAIDVLYTFKHPELFGSWSLRLQPFQTPASPPNLPKVSSNGAKKSLKKWVSESQTNSFFHPFKQLPIDGNISSWFRCIFRGFFQLISSSF